jgi:hypothetical protein
MRRFRTASPRSKAPSLIGSIVGLLLIVSAIVAIWLSHDDLLTTLDAINRPSPLLIVAALTLPLLNWLVISWSFCLLYRPTSHIPFGEMTSLIATAWLLNYLPLRPGMFGRLAYHRKVNGIPLRVSAVVLVQGVGISVACSVWLLAIAALLADRSSMLNWTAAALGVPVLLTIGSIATRRTHSQLSILLAAGVARWLDLLIWSARYWVVFRLIGSPIDISHAVLFAAVAQIVLLIPLTGNGMGFREWTIGLVATRFVATAVNVGLVADLVNRIAELVVAIPTGLIAWSILSKKLTPPQKPASPSA